MLHLCKLVEFESQERSRETKVNSKHNSPNGSPKNTRKANRKGVITEKMNEKDLEEKLKEEASTNHIPLREYRDFFAWSYQDLKGISKEVVVHTIPLRVDAILVTQRPYITNPKVAQIIHD